jgi:hypothetical protein
LSKAAEKRALFMGETIIDVYHYVRPLGRPLKECIVSVEHISTETFEGGVVAAAAHAREFCKGVDIFSSGSRITKERWVEAAHVRKLFEVYSDGIWRGGEPPEWSDYDVVVVTDYGHGMMDQQMIDRLPSSLYGPYVAVNVQTNSGNFGFNLATKYGHITVDYLVVDEPEARLATGNQYGDIELSMERLYKTVAEKVVITLGKKGAIGIDKHGICSQPALTDKVVDTLGAGDAFFAITALIAQEATMPEILHIGNAAGACKTGIIGHQRAIRKDELVKLLQ